MAKHNFRTLLLLPLLLICAAPAFSGQAFGDLQSASSVGARAFDGARNCSGTVQLSLKAETALPDQVVTASAPAKSTGKKVWEFTKKAAPYAFVAGVGLWMGVALTGGLGLPAVLFAAVLMMLFVASK